MPPKKTPKQNEDPPPQAKPLSFDIFISYKRRVLKGDGKTYDTVAERKNVERVNRFADLLETKFGFRVTYDKAIDENNWQNQIKGNIAASKTVLILWDKTALNFHNRNYVTVEWREAIQSDPTKIVSAKIEDFNEAEDVPIVVDPENFHDWTSIADETDKDVIVADEGFLKSITKIARRLNREAAVIALAEAWKNRAAAEKANWKLLPGGRFPLLTWVQKFPDDIHAAKIAEVASVEVDHIIREKQTEVTKVERTLESVQGEEKFVRAQNKKLLEDNDRIQKENDALQLSVDDKNLRIRDLVAEKTTLERSAVEKDEAIARLEPIEHAVFEKIETRDPNEISNRLSELITSELDLANSKAAQIELLNRERDLRLEIAELKKTVSSYSLKFWAACSAAALMFAAMAVAFIADYTGLADVENRTVQQPMVVAPIVAAEQTSTPKKPVDLPNVQDALAAIPTTLQPKHDELRETIQPDICANCPELVQIGPGANGVGGISVGRYEITNAEYGQYLKATGAKPGGGCRADVIDQMPAVCLSHKDAENYTRWLSEKTGKRFRLPSSSEWEFFARAGSESQFPWPENCGVAGTDHANCTPCSYANLADQSALRTGVVPGSASVLACDDGAAALQLVTKGSQNSFGVLGVIGNAAEWTSDCKLEPVPARENSELSDKPSPAGVVAPKSRRVCIARGTSYLGSATRARFDYAPFVGAEQRLPQIGFRVVMDHESPTPPVSPSGVRRSVAP